MIGLRKIRKKGASTSLSNVIPIDFLYSIIRCHGGVGAEILVSLRINQNIVSEIWLAAGEVLEGREVGR